MSTRAFKTLCAATLVSASATLSLGCDAVLGSPFDQVVVDGGTAVGATGAGGSQGNAVSVGSSMGMGGGPACDLVTNGERYEAVDIEVWAKPVKTATKGAADFFTSRAGIQVPVDAGTSIGKYKLYTNDDMGHRALYYQCFTDGGHHVTIDAAGDCVCLGYALHGVATAAVDPTHDAPLTQIVGDAPEKTALLPVGGESVTTCLNYGNHVFGGSSGCTANDMIYGAK
jgi:hypothetical protein